MNKTILKIPAERVEKAILLTRNEKVILDADLAALYGVSTKRLKEQVRRNRQRFPEDFMFELTTDEQAVLTAQIKASNLRSQIATSRSHGRILLVRDHLPLRCTRSNTHPLPEGARNMPRLKLSRLIFAIVLATWFASASFAQQAVAPAAAQGAPAPGSGRLVEIKVPAPSLKGNLLGDPTEQSAAVYLPPSYDASPARRFPTLYLLHGFTGNYRGWTQGTSLQMLIDGMIKSGKIHEMIVVVPNGWNAYGGGFYTNSSVTGNWEDYMFRDLVQNIDANFRTIRKPESRGIAGHSMGGYGAVTLAMKHPDVFSAVYALSPCCMGMEGDFTSDNPAWLKTIRLKSKDQLKPRPEALDEFYQIAFIAVSAAFSPNPEHTPFYADFPYKEVEGGRLERNESVFARWRTKMPLYMIDDNKDNLLKLRGIVIDYGQNEQFSHIRITSQLFSKALAEKNIPHVFEMYEGGDHGSKIRQRFETRVLRFFSEKLEGQ